MTVPSPTNRANYTGNNVTVAFSFPYIVYDEGDIKVYLDSVLQSSGYTVTGAGTASVTVTFDTAPATDVAILIKRVVSLVQDTNFENFDGNPADVTEKQFDLVVMMAQELSDGVDRSLKLREDDPTDSIELPLVVDRANKFLAFDSAGDPIASSGATSSGTPFGSTGVSLAATATASDARIVLGLGDVAVLDTTDFGTAAFTASTAYATAAQGARADAALLYSSLKDKVLNGLVLSNGTDATNDIDISAGACVSDDGTTVMTLSAITKQLDAAWAVGTNAGGLDTGSIADTTYHIWVINRPDTDVTDVLFSASATAPTMPTNYTKKKCIGSIVRISGAIRLFAQYGNQFVIHTPLLDINDTGTGSSAKTGTLASIPTGVKVKALINSSVVSNGTYVYISSLDSADLAPAGNAAPLSSNGTGAGANNHAYTEVWTNTSAQIRYRASTNDTFRVAPIGWFDPRR